MLRGKEALAQVLVRGRPPHLDLHFEVLALYVGVSTLVINYRNQASELEWSARFLPSKAPSVKEGHGTYLTETPVGLE